MIRLRYSAGVTEESLEIVRRWNDAFNDRDWRAYAAALTEDVEFNVGGGLDVDVHVGRESAVASVRERYDELWSEMRAEIEEASEVEPNRVLVHFRVFARGKSSGAAVRADRWAVVDLVDGKIKRYVYGEDLAKALEVAGITE